MARRFSIRGLAAGGVYVRDGDLSHFNEDGNDIIAEYIAPKLKKIANNN